eukprot:GFUD01000499.1.p1 GENE.GFUD01000499.1~~GFUD01000499.1.p1  ORF type:complete len:859 (+),score=220.76 GFUD01000499.1:44-2620(+)
MEGKGKRKLEGEREVEERRNFHQYQYTRNLQRIFNQESNFKFRSLGSYDEDKELLSPTESEPDDMASGDLARVKLEDEPDLVHRRVSGGGLQLPGSRKSDDLEIIDSDLQDQSNTEENVVSPPRSLIQKHFLSSPYKSKDPPDSTSPDSKDFCPRAWFHVEKDISDSGFCHRLSWKCCFLCFCLPICYPCYLTRTIRRRLKDEERKIVEEGGLVFTGQVEVNSALSSKHSTLHSKHSTLRSKQSTLPSKHSTLQSNPRPPDGKDNPSTEHLSMNVIILQSGSSSKLLKFIQESKLLTKLDDKESSNTNSEEKNQCDQQETSNKEREEDAAQTSTKADSPILLRKHLKGLAPRSPPKPIVKSNSSHYKSALSEVRHSSSFTKHKSRISDLFYSLESNLDLDGQTQTGSEKPPLPTAIKDIDEKKKISPNSHMLSSLPSMTSGRFYSANSSLFSEMSSPRSVGTVDLSPTRESIKNVLAMKRSNSTDTMRRNQTYDYVEPIVEIVDHMGDDLNIESEEDLCHVKCLDRNTKFTLDIIKNTKSLDRERKVTIASLDNNSGKSFLKKSLSIHSPYENITRVLGSLEELEIVHKPLGAKNSVKFSSSGSSSFDVFGRKSKFYSFHTHSVARTLSGLKKLPKLGVKQLGTRVEELDSGPTVIETVNEEGELAGWSTKDIYDIVSKDLPSMDIVVMVVNQDEKKMLDKTLNRSTGVIGYIKEYWSGFFPLLLIETANKNGETDPIESKTIKMINSMFSVTHRIIIDDLENSADFIFESVARFYTHIKIFQCEKFQQSLHTERLGQLISLSLTEKFWICSGLCKMRTSQRAMEGRKRGQSILRTIRNSTILKRVISTDEEAGEEGT